MRVVMDITIEDETEATKMMVYHLKLACAYFECTKDDRGREANIEMRKQLTDSWLNASSSFVDVLCSSYEDTDK